MARLSSNHSASIFYAYCQIVLPLFVLLLQIFSPLMASGSTVEFLPGFKGPLPFHLETGHVGIGESEEVQVFYYFIKSENNHEDDPILLWLSGGPGCSGLMGLAFEIGPLAFVNQEYNGSLPSLVLRPQSWTKVSSIIFVDLPIGAGFSYTNEKEIVEQSDWTLIHHAHQFLRKWLINHPEYLSHKVYLSGDSYSGIPIPALFQEISYANENGVQPRINIQGYILGNPVTTKHEINYAIPFAHGMGLISDELYESLQQNCGGEYRNIDPKNLSCLRDFQSFQELIAEVDQYQILEPAFCGYDLKMVPQRSILKRSLAEKVEATNTASRCRRHGYLQAQHWANNGCVRKALHVKEGTGRHWTRCNHNMPFKFEINDSFHFHVNLSAKGYRSLIFSGDHDMACSFLSTQAWIRSLNYSIVDDWRPWHVNGQVAGYTRTYSNRMTFATVKGAGHTAPEFKPDECLAMFERWISNENL
ncbi:serine carboxypeptidase-like 11 [Prosopis cineraria]|uniref:serine carboxypeptidase-like 11 n=1 Tax=Prosopis cineraria TaxID=364024 RepID=UPI002410578C|nr:serine carboxypeptidase-like 11 [Prosopis cineraria]